MSNQVAVGDVMTASNINDIERRKPTGAIVTATEGETNTAFDNMATVGPAVTVTTGTSALVFLYCRSEHATVGAAALMGFAVSGASTVAAADTSSLDHRPDTAGRVLSLSAVFLVTGLTAGSNTFTAKYRTDSGTATFRDRKIIVIPQD